MKTPIYTGLAQSDLDFANFKALHADLSDYAGANMDWNPATKQFDAAAPPPAGGGPNVLITVNVKDAPYSAVGNGVADDSAAINAAIAAVVSGGGGTVFFPKGIYLCNGPFHTFWKSILVIPMVDGTAAPAVTLELRGENFPTWNAPGYPNNFQFFSTIKTTRTDGMTADSNGFAAILAANQPRGNLVNSTYSTMNGCMVRVTRLQFLVPDDPTMGGIRLDGCGMASVDECNVNAGGAEPMHGTTGVWMPNAINWSISWLNKTNVSGFGFGFKLSEHCTAPWIQSWANKVGICFLEAMYPSRVGLLFGNNPNVVQFLGYHTTDLYMEGEHAFGGAPPWQNALHEISDPGNKGMGIVRYHIGHGNNDQPPVAASVDGGTGLTIIDLVSGNYSANTTQGSAGGASLLAANILARNPLIIGYGDTKLSRFQTSVAKLENVLLYNPITFANLPSAGGGSIAVGEVACVSDAAAGLGVGALVTVGGGATSYLIWWNGANWVVVGAPTGAPVYIGTDARLVSISGGMKLQARNTSLNTWADVDQWTNP